MRVTIDERLARLCAEFSVTKIGEWLERKFASYDTSRADVISISENKNDKEYFKSARLLGFVRDLPDGTIEGRNRPLLVAAVEMRKILTERTSRQAQFNFAKRVLQNAVRSGAAGLNGYPSQGLFFFYDQDRFFRISLVTGEMDGRKFKFNEAKRQSFYINPDRPNNIAKSRLSETISSYADLKGAFSVETLTKEFYGKLFAWYEWAMKPETGVSFPNDITDKGADNQKYNSIALIRLLTRLMFTWFLRQKDDLVGGALFDVVKLKLILKKTDLQSCDDDNYYRCILQNLFFATFNCDPRHRVRRFVKVFQGKSDPADAGITTLYRYENEFKDSKLFLEEMRKIPFLNCALFDCLDNVVREDRKTGKKSVYYYDGFSRDKTRQAHVPNGLFFNNERGLIKLFDAYEFTIDENNADDADVALDPELLGKVFENLLGAYNEETKETARKATGSFYTPREIVNYMVEESLKNLIRTKLPNVKDGWLEDIFGTKEKSERKELPFDKETAEAISRVLYSCKVLDPACGSGAFPMGVLNCMVRVLCRLDPSDLILKKIVADAYLTEKGRIDPNLPKAVVEERRADIEYSFKTGQLHPEYMRKMLIIERCIYGVDIQPIAIQISKLRFFISLLCDQFRENRDDTQENRGILSLPQLEANFVCANTLIPLPDVDDELKLTYDILEPKRLELAANRHEIFRARSVEKKDSLKARDKQIREEIRDSVYNLLAKPDDAKIRMLEDQISIKRAERKAVQEEVWKEKEIVEQPDLFLPPVKRIVRVDLNAPKREAIDRSIAQAENEIRRERSKAEKQHATMSADYAEMVSGWDPYDQHATSRFFDPKWMFNIKDGFDVVIGNPPYVQLQANGGELAKMYQGCGFKTFDRTGDIYCLFYERGWQLLNTDGNLCYITSDKWMRNDYGQPLRNFFLHNTDCRVLIDITGQQVFDAAVVEANILLFGKTNVGKCEPQALDAKMPIGDALSTSMSSLLSPCRFESSQSWAILSLVELGLRKKVEDKGKRLHGWKIEINYGVKTGFNTAFLIEAGTRAEFIKQDKCSTEILKPVLRGRDIQRYACRQSMWVIDSHNGLKSKGIKRVSISNYPAIKHHLDRFKKELEKRGDKGDTPYNLRDCAYWDLLSKEKIVWGELSDNAKFIISKCYVLNTCFFMVGEKLHYILGLLNSKLISWYFSFISTKSGMGTTRWLKYTIEQLPLVYPNEMQESTIVTLVDRILAAKKKDPEADTTALEAEIDQLVYKLYGLTEEEIAIVEGREEKVKVKGEEREVTRRGRARGSAAKGLAALPDDDEELE